MGGDAPKPQKAPSSGENYADWIKAYAENTDLRNATNISDAQSQLAIANELTPGIMDLMKSYTPEYNRMLLDNQKQFSGEWADLYQQQKARDIQTVADLAPALREAVTDKTTEAIRAQLGDQINTDLALGAQLDPSLRREVEQSIRAAQQARGTTHGNSAISAEAWAKGTRANQLKQQRQAAATQFLQTQAATSFNPWTALTGQSTTNAATLNPSMPQNYAGVNQLAPAAMGLDMQNNQLYNTQMFNYNQANQGTNWGQIAGMALGGGLGAWMGGPTGAMAGASMGGSIGGAF